jgi:hypothetical protein
MGFAEALRRGEDDHGDTPIPIPIIRVSGVETVTKVAIVAKPRSETTCGMANLHVAHVFATLHAGEMTRSSARRRQLTFDGAETVCVYRRILCAFVALGIYCMYALSSIGCFTEALNPSSGSLGCLHLASLPSLSLRMPSDLS